MVAAKGYFDDKEPEPWTIPIQDRFGKLLRPTRHGSARARARTAIRMWIDTQREERSDISKKAWENRKEKTKKEDI